MGGPELSRRRVSVGVSRVPKYGSRSSKLVGDCKRGSGRGGCARSRRRGYGAWLGRFEEFGRVYGGKKGWNICGLGKTATGASVWKFWVRQRVKIESFWVVVVGLFLPVQGCVSRSERQGLRREREAICRQRISERQLLKPPSSTASCYSRRFISFHLALDLKATVYHSFLIHQHEGAGLAWWRHEAAEPVCSRPSCYKMGVLTPIASRNDSGPSCEALQCQLTPRGIAGL